MCLRIDLYSHEILCPYSIMNQGGINSAISNENIQFKSED